MSDFAQALLQGLMIGSVYSLVALGLVLIYKSTGILNLAQGEILMIGAYLAVFFMLQIGIPPWLGFIITIVFAGVLGLVLDRFALRPLIGQPLLSVVIMTLVLGLLLKGIATLIWKGEGKGLGEFIPSGIVSLGTISINQQYLWCFGISMLLFILLVLLFQYTRLGLAMRAVAEDHKVSQGAGINVKTIFSMSWVIACIAAVVGGVLYGSIYSVYLDMGSMGIAKALPVLLLGGLESVPGALVGGLIIGVVEMLTAQYVDPAIGAAFRDIAPLILMVLILLLRPHGLFGLRRIERI